MFDNSGLGPIGF